PRRAGRGTRTACPRRSCEAHSRAISSGGRGGRGNGKRLWVIIARRVTIASKQSGGGGRGGKERGRMRGGKARRAPGRSDGGVLIAGGLAFAATVRDKRTLSRQASDPRPTLTPRPARAGGRGSAAPRGRPG